uniref:E3 ubiquitin-protein ligase SIS3-like n=1 Tax=Erigeron canadensis TaxID=72917 RepID=UPI001CB97197|nr:E3 ubiquitin-protein ligase SIS3-like [Erigeron canadensis]
MVLLSWEQYHKCRLPLHLWIVVDYAVVFVFRLLMLVDNAIAASVGLDDGRQLRGSRYYGRLLVLCILYAVLYPFLWIWSVVGGVWFAGAMKCLPERHQKWGYTVWLLFSFCGLICLAGIFWKRWLIRRKAHLRLVRQGTRVSGYRVLINMIRQPDWVYETPVHDMSVSDQDTNPHNSRMDTCESMRAEAETMIQGLPIYVLRAVPAECSDCPICLEEFCVGQAVRGLPCAHNFHVACIDKWLRLNMKCPRCRCMVFPICNQNETQVDPDRAAISTTHDLITQPSSSSYLVRMQSFLIPANGESTVPFNFSLSPSLNPTSMSTDGILPPVDYSSSPSPTATSNLSNKNAPVLESCPSPSYIPTSAFTTSNKNARLSESCPIPSPIPTSTCKTSTPLYEPCPSLCPTPTSTSTPSKK